MKKKLLLVIFVSLTAICRAQTQPGLSILPTDPNIEYIGRFDFSNKEKPVFMYSGSDIRASFAGTFLSIMLKDDSLRNWFTVKLDDSIFVFKADRKEGIYLLAKNLPDVKHTVEIARRTEWHGGNTTFAGFEIDTAKTLLPLQKKERIMEFIGDSYTCGYGIEGKSREEHFTYETENNYATFGAITARAFEAGYVGICRSGIGMFQGYGGEKSFIQPKFYDEVVTNSEVKWDYSKNPVQVVTICLGGNDLSAALDSVQYVHAYIKFVQKIRLQYPAAKIICIAGPSDTGDKWLKFQSHVFAVVSHFKGIDENVYYFAFNPFKPSGSDWHPNVKEHMEMAEELIPFIRKITGW